MQLTPYSTAVLILHGPFCNLWLDVSSSCGQNVVASHDGISFCDRSTCVPADTVAGFWCISDTSGCSHVRRLEFGPSHCPHPRSIPRSVCAIAVPFLKHACSKPAVWLKCLLFTRRVRSGTFHCLKSEVKSKGKESTTARKTLIHFREISVPH